MPEHMHVIFLPKEHDITKVLQGDIDNVMAVMWDARHDVIIKNI